MVSIKLKFFDIGFIFELFSQNISSSFSPEENERPFFFHHTYYCKLCPEFGPRAIFACDSEERLAWWNIFILDIYIDLSNYTYGK